MLSTRSSDKVAPFTVSVVKRVPSRFFHVTTFTGFFGPRSVLVLGGMVIALYSRLGVHGHISWDLLFME